MPTTISLDEAGALQGPLAIIVHSIEGSIYRVSVVVEGRELRLLERDGKTFQRRSVTHVRDALRECAIASMVLRQQSAYDEMIGHAPRADCNTLEVSLAVDPEQI